MPREDIYDILVENEYRLPNGWGSTKRAREDIDSFLEEVVKPEGKVKESIELYSDRQWDILVWRLYDNKHVE